jgi:hypothetical protein
MPEQRRARRLVVNQPAVLEVVGQPPMELPPEVAEVYSRVESDPRAIGRRAPGVVRDLSTNGAFLVTEPLPLLSRIALEFELEAQRVEALAWVLWRRARDAEVMTPQGQVVLPRGVGVLFESIPLEVRIAIAKAVDR